MQPEDRQAAQAMFTLASQFIYCEPTAEEVKSYAEADLFAEAPFAADDEALTAGLAAMRAWCAEAVAAGEEGFDEQVAALRRDQFQTFVGAGVPDAPSWAGYYMSPSSQLLSEDTLPVRRLYRKFGLKLEHQNAEPDDNLGIMLGFIAHLIALEDDDVCDEMREDALAAQEELFIEHILPWIPAWRYKTTKHARTSFYRGVGDFTFGLIRAYCAERFGTVWHEDSESFTRRVQDGE